MKCSSCGNDLKEGVSFCPVCGSPAGQEEGPVKMETPVTVIKDPAPKGPGRKGPVLAAAAAALLLILLLVLPKLLKGDPRARLEEQLRLGAAYLQEMNFDMALDAYAAAIEIDEREPRAYLGRAGVYRALAEQTAENAQSEEELDAARRYADQADEDTDKADEIIGSDDYAPEEENVITPEDIEESRRQNEEIRTEIIQRILEITDVDVDAVVQEVLGLPYIGNTGYGEYITEDSWDLYDGAGYISAILRDLEGDGLEEILVVSLEGETTLGSGSNALYLHVLEYGEEGWKESSRRNMEEDPAGMVISSHRLQPLNKDIFLRQEGEITAVYAETEASDYYERSSRAWSLFRYVYDGSEIALTGIGDTAAGEAEVDGQFYLFDRERAQYDPDADQDQAAHAWDLFEKITAAGLPVLKDGAFASGIMRSDASFTPMATFSRKVNINFDTYNIADRYQGTRVRLIDWIIRTTGELTADQEALLYENFFLGLVQEAGYSAQNARCFFTYYDVDGDGHYEMLTNLDEQPEKIYTIREGRVEEFSLDYEAQDGESISLDVDKDGTIFMVSTRNPQWDQYHNYFISADYTVYDLAFDDEGVSLQEVQSFRGSYSRIGRNSFLHWFYDPSDVSFDLSYLVYRLNTQLKYEYSFGSNFTVDGSVVSGTFSKAPGDGASFGGNVEIRLDEGTADVYYNTEMEGYRATEHLDLR